MNLPNIETKRLLLRPFLISDAKRVQHLAGDIRIYQTTLNLPHPYEDGMAEKWIATHMSTFFNGDGVSLAVVLDDEVIGAIGLNAAKSHRRAELGYWIGVPYWGNGYCTEAASALIHYGFSQMNLHKITACHIENNPASGRVMEKAGMIREGILKDEVYKDDEFHNLVVYGSVDETVKSVT